MMTVITDPHNFAVNLKIMKILKVLKTKFKYVQN